ncbi:hypothetical protein RJ532_004081 [Escherichia coli]|nr:hypothetical protein [Escherichia coli]
MSRWPGCGGAAESRRGEVAPVLRDMEQKNVIHTLNQSVSYSLIVGSVHMGHKGGVKKHPSRGGFLIFLCFKFLSIKLSATLFRFRLSADRSVSSYNDSLAECVS